MRMNSHLRSLRVTLHQMMRCDSVFIPSDQHTGGMLILEVEIIQPGNIQFGQYGLHEALSRCTDFEEIADGLVASLDTC